ncbi:hypothetical protein AVEN_226508-1 [Araneus ventricosus]|uniref:Uncharacterized protein n=1 Tax=Araneus ventricosus TaxID=182803 RepID=A0A4Y2N0E1_ARAVE|nr:hypothetical protein AVEN_226508-1 [Araneus ventricosus]
MTKLERNHTSHSERLCCHQPYVCYYSQTRNPGFVLKKYVVFLTGHSNLAVEKRKCLEERAKLDVFGDFSRRNKHSRLFGENHQGDRGESYGENLQGVTQDHCDEELLFSLLDQWKINFSCYGSKQMRFILNDLSFFLYIRNQTGRIEI